MAPAQTRQRNPRGAGGRLREEIVAAAVTVLDAGAQRLTLTAVARQAGIAGPSIYDHFATVEDIRLEVIRRCYLDLTDRITTAQAEIADPVARLEAICGAYLDYGARFPFRYSLLFRAARGEAEKSAVGEQGAAALQTLVDGIAECRAAGRSTCTDPYAAALAVWSAIHGLATLRASRPTFSRLHSDEVTEHVVHRLACIERRS